MSLMKTLKIVNFSKILVRNFTEENSPKKENQNIYNLEEVKYRDYLNIPNGDVGVASE